MIGEIMNGNTAADEALQVHIFALFELTKEEIERIHEVTKGRNKS